ncbi:uncharacterized protein LOC131463655 [Solea solea]|uniref:uncharacterized protein LOC131463655 n=1 Tax=Solea solea TaxID=90069 RepID=UPI00272A3790|nr:uncharacterized protein LOC131463655 [Solea solea]
MVHFIPLPKLPSAEETAEVVLHLLFRLHGFPRDILSDRGPQFVARFWKAFCNLLRATVSLSSGHHPQTNGQTERLNQELETGLRCLASRNPSSWSKHVIWVEYAHNTLPCSSSGMSPFQCAYGYQPPLFPSLQREASVPSALDLVRRCHWIWTRQALLRNSARYKKAADRHRLPAPSYQSGHRVWLSTRDLPLRVESLAMVHEGSSHVPCQSTEAAVGKHIGPSLQSPATPRFIGGGPVYTVKKLLAVRLQGRGRQYLVDWEGYGPEERSWVSARNIMDLVLIQDFHRLHPEEPGPSGAGR